MPIYEYGCTKCGHEMEVLQKIADKPLTRCPKCKGKLEKLFSQTSFQLKGTGWYVTDYSKSGSGKPGKPEKTDAGEKKSDTTETTAEKKTETEKKPDAEPKKKTEPVAA